MMLAEARFQSLAQHIGVLVGCGSVCVYLGCAEPELRHPLLNQHCMRRYGSVDSFGSTTGCELLKDERVHALRDMAIQSGQIQWFDDTHFLDKHLGVESLAIAALERPAGVLGFVLLTDPYAEAFYAGERLLLSQYVPQVAEVLEQILAEMSIDSPYQLLRSAGEERTQRPTYTGGQDVERLLPAAPSLPEYAQLQQQLKELERLKHEFISMVSHELRTPLTAIKGYAVLLKAYGFTAGSGESTIGEMSLIQQREYVDSIMEQTSHLEVLISDLLDISRMQAGHISLRNSEVNLVLLCQRVARFVQQRADQEQAGHYTIACSLPLDLPCIWADADRVRQILTNLLENAVKYSPQGGVIEVVASACTPGVTDAVDDEVVSASNDIGGSQETGVMFITVRDHGVGIAEEQFGQLFKPFARLEHPDIPGVGLGLYISRKLVEAMGGEMRLSSRKGVGTSITFTLPILTSAPMVSSGDVPTTVLTPS